MIFFFNWVFVQLLFVKVISKWFLSLKLIFVFDFFLGVCECVIEVFLLGLMW